LGREGSSRLLPLMNGDGKSIKDQIRSLSSQSNPREQDRPYGGGVKYPCELLEGHGCLRENEEGVVQLKNGVKVCLLF